MVRLNIVQLTKRVPLIQFRKGGSALTNKPAASQQASSKDSGAKKTSGGPAIEDWELPARFARKPIDPLEAEYINNGGIPN
ncbi:uncharacterized protein LOC116803652 isoform X1 [Drosophila mojavensis]|uniref:Tes14 n=2 Tax=mojavensis species complex TaxID=198037 RepID=Q2VKJ4_DROMO|nr:uncharacterized protein LOC116803652 isoform X1 [Drosophila mojavensis]XP_017867088.1 PREDICTED: uncharacterized protein LOC108616416 isoform X1 [Drosophila arizonae]AAZ42654.1 Tes14 [Drosophila arizonae]AAZ42655.1 Tes14 [Drosophila arizonae]AAZ42656.1 Tes14 [Drosophila arizonae]AAZ42657.1 Tes14 [Drosophila arizonae]AAZ42658.1 Tes14 [Drosophila arizonae]